MEIVQTLAIVNSRNTRILLSCGIISSLLYFGTDLIASFIWNVYSMRDQTVSELFAIDAPPRNLVLVSFMIYAFLIYAFGTGLWKSAGTMRSVRLGAVFLISKEVLGLAGTWFFPIHLRGIPGTTADTVHGVVTMVGVLCIALSMGFLAYAQGTSFRVYTVLTIAIFMACGIAAGTYADELSNNQPTPGLGILERINIYLFLLWICVLAIRFMKRPETL